MFVEAIHILCFSIVILSWFLIFSVDTMLLYSIIYVVMLYRYLVSYLITSLYIFLLTYYSSGIEALTLNSGSTMVVTAQLQLSVPEL